MQTQGGRPVLHVDIGGRELIPLHLMGDGFQRIIEILVYAFSAQGGLLLIDEVENGLHYSALHGIWEALAEASRTADVQVFATTHSYECIRAAHEAFSSSDSYELRVDRLYMDSDMQPALASYDRDTLETSFDLMWEIR